MDGSLEYSKKLMMCEIHPTIDLQTHYTGQFFKNILQFEHNWKATRRILVQELQNKCYQKIDLYFSGEILCLQSTTSKAVWMP